MAVKDFSKNIEDFVGSLIKASEKETPTFVGRFYGFDAVVEHKTLLLVNPALQYSEAKGFAIFLAKHGWDQGAQLGVVTYALPGELFPREAHYVNVDRITVRRDKMYDELSRLSRIMEEYNSVFSNA